MNRKLSPKSVRLAMSGAVDQAVFRDVEWSVQGAVDQVVGVVVDQVVYWAVSGAVFQAMRVSPPHPNLDRFLVEVRQNRARRDAT